MARIRTLKPEIWATPSVGTLTRDARLLFVGLITQADDEGRMLAVPRQVAGNCYPFDEDVTGEQITGWLAEIEVAGLIRTYESGGGRYLELSGWSRHQKISKPTPSRLPHPPWETQECPGEPRLDPASALGDQDQEDDQDLYLDQDQDRAAAWIAQGKIRCLDGVDPSYVYSKYVKKTPASKQSLDHFLAWCDNEKPVSVHRLDRSVDAMLRKRVTP